MAAVITEEKWLSLMKLASYWIVILGLTVLCFSFIPQHIVNNDVAAVIAIFAIVVFAINISLGFFGPTSEGNCSSGEWTISGWVSTLFALLSVAGYSAASVYRKEHPISEQWLKCIWQAILTSTMCCCLHLFSSSCRLSLVRATPILLYMAFLPIVISDRMPFAFQRSCSSPFYLVFVVFTLLVAGLVYRMPDVTISIKRELFRGWKPECLPGRNAIVIPSEILPMTCAILCTVYLTCCLQWSQVGFIVQGRGPISDAIYHVSWSLIRPFYTLLFGMYWLKNTYGFPSFQAVASGFGFLYFGLLCPLASTGMSAPYDFTCQGGQVLQGPTYSQDKSGHAAHHFEGILFNLSMILFVFAGISSNSWITDSGSRVMHYVIVSSMMAALTMIVVVRLELAGSPANFLIWAFTLYFTGYWLIIIVSTLVLTSMRRHLLVVETQHSFIAIDQPYVKS